MKRVLVRLVALVLVLLMSWGHTSAALAADSLSGEYKQDTLSVLETLKTALNLPIDAPERGPAQAEARKLINDFTARYRRNGSVAKLSSYTTMRTALNSLAGHYSSYPNRPVPKKLKDRLELEFGQVATAINRGN
ncbi:MAG TPA: photosystem II protein Psb27 [Thermosynechococcaceae cyanobacterium]